MLYASTYAIYLFLRRIFCYEPGIYEKITNQFRYVFRSNSELREAVFLWCYNKNNAIKKYGHISLWRTHRVTSMVRLFCQKFQFNDNIRHWDVSNVTNMRFMFYGCERFDQVLDLWDTAGVTSMVSMFEGCRRFNGNIRSWNVSNVTEFQFMFSGCRLFNQDLSHWNLRSAESMIYMFDNCKSLDKIDILCKRWNFEGIYTFGIFNNKIIQYKINYNKPLNKLERKQLKDVSLFFNKKYYEKI